MFGNPAFFEKSTFLPVLGRFCMSAVWRGFDFLDAAIFSKNAGDLLSLIMRFLYSWLHPASAGYRVGVVYPNISVFKSNN
jgi:hypothetical protein